MVLETFIETVQASQIKTKNVYDLINSCHSEYKKAWISKLYHAYLPDFYNMYNAVNFNRFPNALIRLQGR
jgi:hypothetical protein